MELEAEVKVKNDFGLHIRPANMIVKLLHSSSSEVFFTYKGRTINAKSILSILSLAAEKNAKLLVSIKGKDAKTTMKGILSAFKAGFGEG